MTLMMFLFRISESPRQEKFLYIYAENAKFFFFKRKYILLDCFCWDKPAVRTFSASNVSTGFVFPPSLACSLPRAQNTECLINRNFCFLNTRRLQWPCRVRGGGGIVCPASHVGMPLQVASRSRSSCHVFFNFYLFIGSILLTCLSN